MSDSFSDWTAKIAEAYCVLHRISCKRKFTDAELARPLEQLKRQTDYAETMIRRDQLALHEGRPDHDQDVFGRQLKAGT